jgi:hypothetical protein
MAGFQLSINGRFWVSTEAREQSETMAYLREENTGSTRRSYKTSECG